MILGIGSDLVDIRRIEKVLAQRGDRFAARLFTPIEREKARRSVYPARVYAKRFAAKEAFSKALGTGIKAGVYFKDMGVVNLPSGKPTIEATGGALRRLSSLVPEGTKVMVHLSITDDYPLAQAFVVIESLAP